ncbi:MAG: tRNA (adenosine(37)-N6)-threonylcarbamoyltransferase complex dimerization subunit type 1 TsaB [Chloroflexota bacterium]|nr:tRNA (adenosine(37)-N6)-threonylcarbamoyltransferase complex dimerization subunit type 1 TsaB [Chloroflexota bacterium]
MIVALETSSTDLSIAVAVPEQRRVLVDAWSGGQRHARELLPRLVALASRLGVPLGSAAAVVVGIGPGSFTGLRVGVSVAKGIALGAGCPIIGHSSLTAWLDAEPHARAALGRAGVAEGYLLRRNAGAPAIVELGAIAPEDGPLVAPAELIEQLRLADARPPYGSARALVDIATRRLAAGGGGDALETLEPAYLRQPRGVEGAAVAASGTP